MRAYLLAGLLLTLSGASWADSTQREHYVPCPRGMEGMCGDIPGAVTSAVGAGEIICDEDEFRSKKRKISGWLGKLRDIRNDVLQIKTSITWLANQPSYASKRQQLSALAARADAIMTGLIDPTVDEMTRMKPCYESNRRASDGCHHLSCGDPRMVVQNIENVGPALVTFRGEIEASRPGLLAGLPTRITSGSRNVCEDHRVRFGNNWIGDPPRIGCQQHMAMSLTSVTQATEVVARKVGELSD